MPHSKLTTVLTLEVNTCPLRVAESAPIPLAAFVMTTGGLPDGAVVVKVMSAPLVVPLVLVATTR